MGRPGLFKVQGRLSKAETSSPRATGIPARPTRQPNRNSGRSGDEDFGDDASVNREDGPSRPLRPQAEPRARDPRDDHRQPDPQEDRLDTQEPIRDEDLLLGRVEAGGMCEDEVVRPRVRKDRDEAARRPTHREDPFARPEEGVYLVLLLIEDEDVDDATVRILELPDDPAAAQDLDLEDIEPRPRGNRGGRRPHPLQEGRRDEGLASEEQCDAEDKKGDRDSPSPLSLVLLDRSSPCPQERRGTS